MNYIILLNLTLGLLSTITAMEKTTSKNFHTWVLTKDIKPVKISKQIADQSNLITVLSEPGALDISPIPVPVNKKELNFFCSAITKSSNYLVKNLSDKEYSLLMDITAKLKCPLFYAELMEPLMPIQELLNIFALNYINKATLKKIIYKKYLKRKRLNCYHENNTNTLSIIFSNNGKYFTETILTPHDKFITHLWKTKTFARIKKFDDCDNITLSPNSNYIIFGNELYFIKNQSCHPISFYKYTKPLVSPDGCFFIQNSKDDKSYILYNTKTFFTIKLLSKHYNDQTNFCFHPNNTTLLYSTSKNSNDITIYDLENYNHQCTKIYSETPLSSHHRNIITMNTDGSLLLLNHNTLLNIQNLHNPTIIKEWEYNRKIQQFYKTFFIPNKNIIILQPSEKTFYLINEFGDIITKYNSLATNIVTDNTGNYLAFLTLDEKNETPKTINLWNLSHLPSRIKVIKINTDTSYIHKMEFTKDQLLLTQSYITKLWDMDGDEILNLGQSQANAINPQTGSIITSNNLETVVLGAFKSRKKIPGPKEMNYFNINAPKAVTTINNIIKSLTLSEALLLKECFAHKKTNKRKLYPNLPNGRALASFTKKYKYLIKNFELHKTEYPK